MQWVAWCFVPKVTNYSIAVYNKLLSLAALGDVLVLPEGENESIVCTALDDVNLVITWIVNGRISTDEDMRFVVEEEETSVDNGLKGSTIIFNATIDVNNTNLSCVVSNIAELTLVLTLEVTITLQGHIIIIVANTILLRYQILFRHSSSS